MRTQIYSLGERELSEASFAAFLDDNTKKDPKYARMKKIMKIALQQELTERQRECITLYYIKKKKVCEIADMLSIKPTTVYKHLRTGMTALKKTAVYL
ncbi:MAG: RNA polymerase sigma factor [Acutalibacteraceae bacterium]